MKFLTAQTTLQQHIAAHCTVLQPTAVGRYRVEGGGRVNLQVRDRKTHNAAHCNAMHHTLQHTREEGGGQLQLQVRDRTRHAAALCVVHAVVCIVGRVSTYSSVFVHVGVNAYVRICCGCVLMLYVVYFHCGCACICTCVRSSI